MNRLQRYDQYVSSPAALGPTDSGIPEEVLVLDDRNGLTPSDMVDRKLQDLLGVHREQVATRQGRYEFRIIAQGKRPQSPLRGRLERV